MTKRGTATGEDLSTSGKQAGRGSTEEEAYRRLRTTGDPFRAFVANVSAGFEWLFHAARRD